MTGSSLKYYVSPERRFEKAETGSIWRFKYPDAPVSAGTRVVFHLPEGKNPEFFYEYEHNLIDNYCVVISLGEIRKTLVDNGTHRRTSIVLYKVLAKLANGETKIGWINRAAVRGLRICNG